MYKRKYGEMVDVNKPTDIYKLDLANNKKYIGKTADFDKRMDDHFSGRGSQVTKKFKPLSGEVIDRCPGYFASSLEQEHTDDCIEEYGYENVRGGRYTNSKTLEYTPPTCYRCGREGHYSSNCYAKTDASGYRL